VVKASIVRHKYIPLKTAFDIPCYLLEQWGIQNVSGRQAMDPSRSNVSLRVHDGNELSHGRPDSVKADDGYLNDSVMRVREESGGFDVNHCKPIFPRRQRSRHVVATIDSYTAHRQAGRSWPHQRCGRNGAS
jgi:hypothetical protein